MMFWTDDLPMVWSEIVQTIFHSANRDFYIFTYLFIYLKFHGEKWIVWKEERGRRQEMQNKDGDLQQIFDIPMSIQMLISLKV